MAEGKENDKWPSNQEKFLSWFWDGQNGNNLIKRLNSYSDDNKLIDHIRRENFLPHIYFIVINGIPDAFDEKETFINAYKKGWRFVKVGRTQKDITKETNNRMEVVKLQIEKKFGKANASVLDRVRIGSIDSTPFRKTEDRIRQKIGIHINNDCAKNLGLPFHTEWVFTTQDRITEMEKRIEEAKVKNEFDTIDIFKTPFLELSQLPEGVEKLLLKAK